MSAAADVVLDYLRAQADVIAGRADDVRVDAPDAVHRSRVATRRSRSALRTFAPLFRRRAVRTLRDELAWHADHLGAPRDAEVLKERLLAALDTLPADPASRPVADRLTASLDDTHARAHASLVESMDTERYPAMRATLDWFLADPPLRKSARDAGIDVLPDLLERAVDRVGRLTERAAEIDEDAHRWHEVRKAAKAVRYACEAMEASVPGLSDEVTAWEAVTESLGELQDTAVASDLIVQVARRSGADPDTGAWRVLRDAQSDRRRAAFAEGQLALAAVLDRRP